MFVFMLGKRLYLERFSTRMVERCPMTLKITGFVADTDTWDDKSDGVIKSFSLLEPPKQIPVTYQVICWTFTAKRSVK